MSGRHFFEHDPRGPSTSKPNYQRQNFAMGGRHKDKKYRNSGGKNRVDLDGDVDMGGNAYQHFERRFNPYGPHNLKNNRRKTKKNSGQGMNRQRGNGDNGEHSWYRITIPYGKKAGKSFILKAITSFCKMSFTPYNFQFVKNNAEFYVNGYSVASVIKEVNHKLKFPDGLKMHVHVTFTSSPPSIMDESVIEIIKNAMSSCYDPAKHLLNLMKFHHMDALKSNALHVPLNRPIVFKEVIRIIKENIPEIEILILSDNKLFSLDHTSMLLVCKNLKFINLQNNKLRTVNDLNHLKGIDLEELILDGNPLCDDYKDKSSYISVIRERFPKLKRLDGHDLPAPIFFELGNETLPVSKKYFFAAGDVKDLVAFFLERYYAIYDSGDRTGLLEAYHEQACFSLSLSKNTTQKSKQDQTRIKEGSLAAYSVDDRNLLRVTHSSERFRLLKQGKLGVVNTLQELPQTMHDLPSFSVDIFHARPDLMSFSVLGVFKEVGADINSATMKTFSRTFVVVPQGQGFVIVNETLFIAHASSEQQEKAFKLPAPTPSPSPAPPADEKTLNEKNLLVHELSKQTGMNIPFSTKCLEENDWDFQRALAVFMEFQSGGKLPPEAFVTVPM